MNWIPCSGSIVSTARELKGAFDEVIRRKSLSRSAEQIQVLLVLKEREQAVVPATCFGPVCRDPDDDLVLACAVEGRADLIVSGDLDLLTLRFTKHTDRESPPIASQIQHPQPRTIEGDDQAL